ncbi:hypothetical protein BGX38DRAFT_1252026 [Terfezia claveryi]|nr:hypothetical protein BGX38DRAFT_1252026 [Terfezia claveryi]
MDSDQSTTTEQLAQLRKARTLCLQDDVYWPRIFEGILPILKSGVPELRRWGVEFIADFEALDTLVDLIHENEAESLKYAVQSSASIYPLIFRYICTNPTKNEEWQKMGSIKQRILWLWTLALRLIQVQTPGVTDPRLANKSEISLAAVPSNHPLLPISALEAEAQGLLDRLLGARSSISNKILNAILGFNPLSVAIKNPTTKNKLMAKCLEKTVRILLLNLIRPNPTGPHFQKISQHLHRLSQAKAEIFDDTSRKRPAVAPPVAQATDAAKRQKFESAPTYANLFTLTRDAALTNFDAQILPIDLVVQITLATFYSVNQQTLDVAIQTLTSPPDSPPRPVGQPAPISEESRDMEDIEEDEDMEDEYQVGTYKLPPPPPPTAEQRIEAACANVDRMFGVLDGLDKAPLVQRKNKGGLMRVAASTWDRDGWITLIVRLATRGLGACDVEVKTEDGRIQSIPSPLAQYIRERLLAYVLADFRQNLDSAVTWLYEEWYNDSVMRVQPMGESRILQYPIWLAKVVDGILPFLEAKDRLVIRFLSEVPELSREILNKFKILCLDPDRSTLGIQILHYNAMLRPPVREICLDLFEDFYHNHKELSSISGKFLRKWRPLALEAPSAPQKEEPDSAMNGVHSEAVETKQPS